MITFFLKDKQHRDMKKIRLTENDLHKIIENAVNKIIKEEGLGGTSTFSVNSPAGSLGDPTGQQKNHIDVPVGDVQRKKIYSPKNNENNTVDMNPALERKNGKGGSISVNMEK